MQPLRVLVFDTSALATLGQTSTRKKQKQIKKDERRAKRAFSLNRSKIALFFA